MPKLTKHQTNKQKMLNKWFKVIGNSSPMVDSISCQSSSGRQTPSLDANEKSTIAKLIDSSPANPPFRKKAITSIERTRKLSILLKHQQYLVSYCYINLGWFIIRIFRSTSCWCDPIACADEICHLAPCFPSHDFVDVLPISFFFCISFAYEQNMLHSFLIFARITHSAI